ncbi:transferrin-binding protein-like solute binding protein [Actinobacillus suis]|uniref:Transferrin-binding protein B n=2 Tax=Actinobacillus suis TaxID=716 RepID=K0G9P7_ACTSU|nr:transferrin-binding protein-like solute binding protein [Actinobacillus suis]AFU18395.1 transferrin binding protein-like solute binding protein [Actinobacillus suis H91-0380]AIJ30531.1 transferrin binding protein-like solute binding protein [Actinobacillus suis ATCC 33415]MCO4167331.1 transferrin-binding protein-like solute binding protein [Actinobacillus suis]MCO4169023.1 transferrin-binding protein-like solute binding protein [Actinobacillus suis]MCQ9629652.1 transferrin-binding protein-l
MKFKKSYIATLFSSLLLVACSNNKGDFGLENTQEKPYKYTPKKPKPIEYGDDITQVKSYEELPELLQPALGAATAIPRRIFNPKASEEAFVSILPRDIHKIEGKLDELPYQEEMLKDPAAKSKVLVHSYDEKRTLSKLKKPNYVRAGFVFVDESGLAKYQDPKTGKDVYRYGKIGYLFYKGIEPAKSLPVDKVIEYVGTWDFTTDAQKGRPPQGFNDAPSAGDRVGAISFDEPTNEDPNKGDIGHRSEFTVDFGKKELKGALYRNNVVYGDTEKKADKVKRYDISAKVFGNRFRGSATAADKQTVYWKDDATLEGGFYGPNAEELAGKFLANNYSLFGVFAAQQTGKSEAETKFDAVQVDLKEAKKLKMDTFGYANQIVVDGKVIPLINQGSSEHTVANKSVKVTACCENLGDVKFGSLNIEGENSRIYLVGERTAVKDLPQKGEVTYKGSWQGEFTHKQNGEVWHTPDKSTAEFIVNFSDKTIRGGFGSGPVSSSVLSLEQGKIEQNGFTGEVRTLKDGFRISDQSTVHINAKVNGGFYGSNASELGGTLLSDEAKNDKATGVFGAKRQVQK